MWMNRRQRDQRAGAKVRLAAAVAVMAATLSACANDMGTGPVAGQDPINDPLEPVNRVVFGFNNIFRDAILEPVTGLYQLVMPEPVQDGVANILDNLRAPVVLANDLLQSEGERAWQTVQRFAIDSTLGLGGIFDPAEGGVLRPMVRISARRWRCGAPVTAPIWCCPCSAPAARATASGGWSMCFSIPSPAGPPTPTGRSSITPASVPPPSIPMAG